MNNFLSLVFILVFLIAWLTFAITWFRIFIIGSQLKKLVKKFDRNIQFEFGFSPKNGLSSQQFLTGVKRLIQLFFLFGSYDSVNSYLAVFMDNKAIYATKEYTIVSRMEKLNKMLGLAIKGFWTMIISWMLGWMILV